MKHLFSVSFKIIILTFTMVTSLEGKGHEGNQIEARRKWLRQKYLNNFKHTLRIYSDVRIVKKKVKRSKNAASFLDELVLEDI